MKNILAPTDFSKTARNAVNYAAETALRTRSRLVLFHAWHPTVIMTETPVVIPPSDEQEKECKKLLKRLRTSLISKYGNTLPIDVVCENGLAADAIVHYVKDHSIDLVVMGNHGAGYLEEKLLGSVTSSVIKRCSVPVLSVNSKSKFKSLKNIVLATDFSRLKNEHVLDPLKTLAGLFRSHIYIVNVAGPGDIRPTPDQAAEGIRLEHLLENYRHSFHTSAGKTVAEGINNFVRETKADLVVMVPHDRNFVQNLFKKSHSKEMAFHAEAPLLTIHE